MNQDDHSFGKYIFVDNFKTREVNNIKEQNKFIGAIREHMKAFGDHIDKLQHEFEANYNYIQYKKPLKLLEYIIKDEPEHLSFNTDFTILKDFIEDQAKEVIKDMQKDSNLIDFFLKAINLGSKIVDYFWKEDSGSIYPVDINFFGGSSKLLFRDDRALDRSQLGLYVPVFKDVELKSFGFNFYPYKKEVQCPFCKEWISLSRYNTVNKFGKDIVLHDDDGIDKTVYFCPNPLVTSNFNEKQSIILVNYTNFTQEHLNILEAFHMLVNQEPITHFNRINETKLQMIDTEIYLLIEDHNPIGYAYWNKAQIKEGDIDCVRQLYILSAYRNQGYAKKLLHHKIDKIEIFITETPNKISYHLIETYFNKKHKGSIYCA